MVSFCTILSLRFKYFINVAYCKTSNISANGDSKVQILDADAEAITMEASESTPDGLDIKTKKKGLHSGIHTFMQTS